MALRHRQLDGRIEIVTPENIAFEYRVAGPFWRLPAYLIDVAIQTVTLSLLSLTLTLSFGSLGLGGLGVGMLLISWFVISWFYGGVFETLWNGQTPGKRMMNLRVVSIDGQPITALQAVLRNVLRAVDALPPLPMTPLPLYLVGLLSAMMNPRFQRLGDLACGTLVIIEEPQRMHGVLRVQEPAVVALAAALPPNVVVGHSMARALAKYVGRRQVFAPARRAEIARHLGEPLAEKFALPAETDHDLLLCALYYRTFISDRPGEAPLPSAAASSASEVIVATSVDAPSAEVLQIKT